MQPDKTIIYTIATVMGVTPCYAVAPEPVAFLKEVQKALQKELSIGGSKISRILKISEESPHEYSIDFEWIIARKKYRCDASVETNEMNKVVEAVIPYVCYRPYIDRQ